MTVSRVLKGIAALMSLACLALAGIPEPDAILHGSVRINGLLIVAADDVTVLARVSAAPNAIGSYQMGDNPTAGDEYVLRMRLESLADGSLQGDNVALIGQTVRVYVKQGTDPETEATSFVVTDRGTIRRIDLSDVRIPDMDSDGDSDLRDVAKFQRCFTGAAGTIGAECPSADLNSDDRVDLTDFAGLSERFTGPS